MIARGLRLGGEQHLALLRTAHREPVWRVRWLAAKGGQQLRLGAVGAGVLGQARRALFGAAREPALVGGCAREVAQLVARGQRE